MRLALLDPRFETEFDHAWGTQRKGTLSLGLKRGNGNGVKMRGPHLHGPYAEKNIGGLACLDVIRTTRPCKFCSSPVGYVDLH